MAMKGFVDAARQTNILMEQKMKEQQEKSKGSEAGIIDISDGQSIPKEKLEELRNNSTQISQKNGVFNYGKKIGNTKENFTKKNDDDFEIQKANLTNNNSFNKNQTDFEKEYLRRQKNEQLRVNKDISVGNGTGTGNSKKNLGIDSRVGNVMAGAIKSTQEKSGEKTNWENCKHLKKDEETLYCKEFHCFCKKDACPYACK